MILKQANETTLDAVERIARTYSVSPLVTNDAENIAALIAFLYELVGVLAADVRDLRERLTPNDRKNWPPSKLGAVPSEREGG